MRTNVTKLLSIGLLLALAFGCKKETETVTVNNPVYNLRGNANAAQETSNPRPASTATGTISGTYNKETNKLNFTVTWTGLLGGNPTAAHFHGPADPGVAASVLKAFPSFPATASGTYSNSFDLTEAEEADFMNGLWYYNIHNSTYPGGEIRGQVFLTQ